MAGEALGVGAVVFFAPVSLFLKVGGDFGVAEGADVFGDAVLGAPPAGVVVLGRRFGPVIVAVFVLGCWFFAAAAEGEEDGEAEGENREAIHLHIQFLGKMLNTNFFGFDNGGLKCLRLGTFEDLALVIMGAKNPLGRWVGDSEPAG
jgi:hypothetical protein